MVAPPPRKRTKKGGKDGNQGTEDGKDGNQETEDGNRVTKDDILIPADTNAEWREKFNEKINKELKSIKEKGATSVLLEDEFRAIFNYLLEVQKSGSNDNDNGTVHGGDTNPSNGTTNEESTSAEKELSGAEKAKRNRWQKYFRLDGSDLKYIGRDDGLTVTHSGRLFSDLQEIYCPENKHVHQKEPTQKKAKEKFGRSITLTLINIFHKSCPICVEDKTQKDAVKKEMDAVKKEQEVNEVERLKEELVEKEKEVKEQVNEVERLKEELVEKEKEVKEQVNEVERLKEELEKKEKEVEALKAVEVFFDSADEEHNYSTDELQVNEVERLKQKLEEKEKDVEALKAQLNEPFDEKMDSVEVFFDNAHEQPNYLTNELQLHDDPPPSLESGKPLLLYSKILEPSESSGARKNVNGRKPISHFWASLRSILYTVGLSEIIHQRYEFNNLMKNETVTETQESDYVLRALQKVVAKVGENQPSQTTLNVLSSYYSNVSEQNTELLDVVEELAPVFDDDTWRKAIEQYGEGTIDDFSAHEELNKLLENNNFEKLRIYFRSKSTSLEHMPNLVNVLSKHCMEFLQEYIMRHNELEEVLKLMEKGEDIKTTTTLCNAASKSVLQCAKKGDITMDVSLCFELLLKWLSLENLFFVTSNNTRYSHLQVSTDNKSDTYKMATLLDRFCIHDHGAYLMIIREGENYARIDDVLSLCLQKGKKMCIVLRSFIMNQKNNQYDVYVTSKHERSKWTLLDDANVFVDAKEALALSSYAKCFFYEVLSEGEYNVLADSKESLIKKLETLRNEAKIVASVLSVGLHCSENGDVEKTMFQLVEKFYLRPNCYPQLFTVQNKLSATGKLYLEEALCIKKYSNEEECNSVMKEYLEENVPLQFFSRFDDKKSVVKVFKQYVLNRITQDLRIYQAPIKSDKLFEKLAEWTIARGTSKVREEQK